MPIKPGKLALAGLISAVLLGWLGWAAGFALPEIAAIDWAALLGLGAAICLILLGRALSFQAAATPAGQIGFLSWLQLAARHQAVFSLFPGGFGDFGFPYLARRIAGIDEAIALRIIAQVRLRDLVFVALLGLGGLSSAGRGVDFAPVAVAVAVTLLWFIDELVRLAMRLSAAILPNGRVTALLAKSAESQPVSGHERLLRTSLTAFVWFSTVAAVILGFAVVGVAIDVGQAMLIVAAVNLAGAIAISIAGLGVSEAGAAAALVISGFAPDRAAVVALMVRPLLLIVIVSVSLVVDLMLTLLRRRQH